MKENEQSPLSTDNEIAVNNTPVMALPDSREQLEMVRELQDLERSVETLGEKFTPPTELLHVPVDILDSWQTQITDNGQPKDVIVFQVCVKETGEIHNVMQTATGVRNKISDFFGKFRAAGIKRKLEDYQLILSEKETNQPNKAIIWARAPKQVASAV